MFNEESLVRIEKIKRMKNFGIIPYAAKFDKKDKISDLISREKEVFRDINDIILDTKMWLQTAGRVILYRSFGKISFGKLQDSTGEIQIMFSRENCAISSNWETGLKELRPVLGEWEEMSAYKFVEKLVDIGDFIGVKWELFMTHKWELTIFVSEFQFLSKAIRSLPEKFHGLQDKESIYRQRYLDLITDKESYERFLFRSRFIKALRDFYDENDFIEIETPILGSSASGAAAAPFITHHNDYDHDFFLRISPETSLKKATVWRFERVFEIGRQFRNEGSDPSHMQEFTSVEHYSAFWDFEDNMRFTEKMFDYLFTKLNLDPIVQIKDKDWNSQSVNFSTPWERIDYIKWVRDASGIDVSAYNVWDEDKLRNDIISKWIRFERMEKMGLNTLIDYLYKKVLRPGIIWPAFVYNYPRTMQPLARVSDENPNIVEQFQLVINWWEAVKAYSELVDPIKQWENFVEQAKNAAAGDEEATSPDDDFVLAMEYGMPCQSGWWMWVDRIITLLTGQENLRDSILFPLTKPINE